MSASSTTPHAPDRFAQKSAAAFCRVSGARGLTPVLDLGMMPLADGLLTREQLAQGNERRFPLELAFSPDSGLMQILETVPPEVLFGHDYPYFSSFSDHLLRHSRENALELIAARGLTSSSLVVELASNDGYLLKNFVEAGIPVLGIDRTGVQAIGSPAQTTPLAPSMPTEKSAMCIEPPLPPFVPSRRP